MCLCFIEMVKFGLFFTSFIRQEKLHLLNTAKAEKISLEGNSFCKVFRILMCLIFT